MSVGTFARNIQALRSREKITQEQFAKSIDVRQASVSQWENGEVERPRQKEVIKNICDTYHITEQDLFGFSDGLYAKQHNLTNSAEPIPSYTYAHVMGNIAAGDPREAIEYTDQQIWVPPELLERDPECFYLCVSGDSMNRTEYQDGTYALISPNTEVNNGDIAAVKVNGDDATIKRYKFFDGAVILEPESTNPEHKRRIIDESDPDAPYVRVLGKAVWSYREPAW